MYPEIYPQYNFGAIGSTIGNLVSAFTQTPSYQPPTVYPYSPYNMPVENTNPFLIYPQSTTGLSSLSLGGNSGMLLLLAAVVIIVLVVK